MNKSNIFFIIYDLERGGPEVRLLELAQGLNNVINFVICVTSTNLLMLEDFKKANANIHVVPIAKPYFEISKIFSIRKLIHESNTRTVNVYDMKGLIIAAVIKKLSRLDLQIIYNNVNSIHQFGKKNTLVFRLLCKNIDHVLSNSYFSLDQMQGFLKNTPGTVIYNGVDQNTYKRDTYLRNSTRNAYGFSETDIVIGTVANFRPQKNYAFLIDSFNEFSSENPSAKLLCVGGGPLLEKMQTYAASLGINQKIVFTGYSNEIPALLNAMDIFTLTSTFEGLPNGILQAMCTQVPVISTSVGGCPELIEHMKTGILIASNNKQEFISALNTLVNNPDLRQKLTQAASESIDLKFSHQAMLENYSKLYQTIERA